jgi:hypothetical protein
MGWHSTLIDIECHENQSVVDRVEEEYSKVWAQLVLPQ